jgi:hypothetical protein
MRYRASARSLSYRWSGFARIGERMTGRGRGNELDAFNVDAAKSRHVPMQLASHAVASMAVSDHALDTAKGLHRETNRHRRELSVDYTSSVVNRWLGSMLSTTTDTSGSSSSRNPRTRARNVSMLWATALASETIASPF